ncbi:hypothetical protein [Streptomyces cavernae]|uniref:hypothetical protein n=1 Tax=Streptomyces cavernae TaxID=2259034 RepID=UPI001EE3DC80|nr:hypothetical protein [Streptomyces cavernae]
MAEHEGQQEFDALMAAITDTLPEDARKDPEFLAEHRAATADVALLREQLSLIGDALAEPPDRAPAPAPAPRRSGLRRSGPRALKLVLAAAVASGMIGGLGWLITQGGGPMASSSGADSAAAKNEGTSGNEDHGAGDEKQSSGGVGPERYLACARLIVEGRVTAVDPVPGTGEDRITLKVTRYYKPDKGKAEITFVMGQDSDPRLRTGGLALVGFSGRAASPDIWSTNKGDIAKDRAWITEALPGSRSLTCG